MSTISVIVVNWNTRDHLRNCLHSLRRSHSPRLLEVIVVDNDSHDGSPEMVVAEFPEVTLVRAGANLGFARANNLAMERARGRLFALVNSDALVHDDALETLADAFESDNRIGLTGPRVTGGDGRLQRTCRHLPTFWNTLCRAVALDRVLGRFRLFSGYEIPDRDHETRREVEVLSGCFCVARRTAVEQVGGLDEQFFFYAEDIDWCKRFKDAGWKRLFVPEARATHFGGGSTAKAPLRYSIEILRATLKYWRKHHGPVGEMACHVLLVAHHALRFVPRAAATALHLGNGELIRPKLQEDFVCLRWLVTGEELFTSATGTVTQP
jgi:GT2 family glycosyltransferase